MMTNWKPGASIRTHLFVAGAMWFLVGIFLIVMGLRWLHAGSIGIAFIAVVLGTLKAFFMLDKVAGKNIDRILQMKEGACIGAVYSLQSWGIVVGMVLLGRLLRASALPRDGIGALYIAVGWALMTSSRKAWRQWMIHRGDRGGFLRS